MTRDNVERKQARTEEERMEDEGTFKIILQIGYGYNNGKFWIDAVFQKDFCTNLTPLNDFSKPRPSYYFKAYRV
mgnify:CR=1 FL=1